MADGRLGASLPQPPNMATAQPQSALAKNRVVDRQACACRRSIVVPALVRCVRSIRRRMAASCRTAQPAESFLLRNPPPADLRNSSYRIESSARKATNDRIRRCVPRSARIPSTQSSYWMRTEPSARHARHARQKRFHPESRQWRKNRRCRLKPTRGQGRGTRGEEYKDIACASVPSHQPLTTNLGQFAGWS